MYLGFVCIYVYIHLEVHIRKARKILPFHLGFVFLGDFHLMMQTYTVYKQFLCVFNIFPILSIQYLCFFNIHTKFCVYIYIEIYAYHICILISIAQRVGFFLETPLCFGCNQFNVFFWWSHQIEGTTCLFICKFLNGEREKTHTHILHWVNPGVRETMNYFNNIIMFFPHDQSYDGYNFHDFLTPKEIMWSCLVGNPCTMPTSHNGCGRHRAPRIFF